MRRLTEAERLLAELANLTTDFGCIGLTTVTMPTRLWKKVRKLGRAALAQSEEKK